MTESTPAPGFTPALGRHALTDRYDAVIAVMTRERRWRARLLDALAPAAGETIVDLGAGTGTTAIEIARAAPGCAMIAVDPDPAVLELAASKAAQAGVAVRFVIALAEDLPADLTPGMADKVVSSLVLHQCSAAAKAGLLAAAHRLLRPGGRLLIADYGAQRTLLMDLLFRQVRMLDGFETTQANRDGAIPGLIAAAGFARVEELSSLATPTGSIALYSGWKAG